MCANKRERWKEGGREEGSGRGRARTYLDTEARDEGVEHGQHGDSAVLDL